MSRRKGETCVRGILAVRITQKEATDLRSARRIRTGT